MGYFEFTSIYYRNNHEFSLMLRNNLRNNLRTNNEGTVQFDWVFPMWESIRGYAQYSNGCGESLIDYDVRIERAGIGILLTDLL